MTYQGDKYHKDKSISDFINLGISENKICIDLMTERLSWSTVNYMDDALLQYFNQRGQAFLQEEVAQFLTYYSKIPAPLDAENVIVLSGCCSVFSALTLVLCDTGEAFPTPIPFHAGFTYTSRLYVKVELIHIHLVSEITEVNTHLFQLTGQVGESHA